MRVIVACTQCHRRYDAQGRRSGSRFRCQCGEVLTVRPPVGHDASVVRCSSCGAPREKKADSCGHCHSDFTLHERDLHSVCPDCLARVSDKARYCHHCAAPMFADQVAGDRSELVCPGCRSRRHLCSRKLGAFPVSVLECPRCTGLWLSLPALEEILVEESRKQGASSGDLPVTGLTADPVRGYRRCPECEELMARRNLARGQSGVIVDVCGRHGIWFDPDELAQLIAWTRSRGVEAVRRDLARLVGSRDTIRKRVARSEARSGTQPNPDRPTDLPGLPSVSSGRNPDHLNADVWFEFASEIAARLFRLVR